MNMPDWLMAMWNVVQAGFKWFFIDVPINWYDAMTASINFQWWMWLIVVTTIVTVVVLDIRFKLKHWIPLHVASIFVVLNAWIGLYILMHPNSKPWATGRDSTIDAVKVPESNIPMVGDALETLNDFSTSTTKSLNDALQVVDNVFATMHAVNVASSFFMAALWAAIICGLLLVPTLLIGHRNRKKALNKQITKTIQKAETAVLVAEVQKRITAGEFDDAIAPRVDALVDEMLQDFTAHVNSTVDTLASQTADVSRAVGVPVRWEQQNRTRE